MAAFGSERVNRKLVPEPMSCPRCRGTGQIVDFDGNVSECPEEECLKLRAVDALGVLPDGRGVFKGGTLKMSVAIKGFELTPETFKNLTTDQAAEIGAIAAVEIKSDGSGYTHPPMVTVKELK
jgi:hypothetical protein